MCDTATAEIVEQASTVNADAYWRDIDGIFEVQSTPPAEQRIQQVAAALRTQHSMIYPVERMLGLEKPLELGS